MKFLVDANLPPGLAFWLSKQGHEASHVGDQPGLTADDRTIFAYARQNGMVIVTKDEDFAVLVTLLTDPPPVVWLRLGHATNAALCNWLEPLLAEIVQRLSAGEILIEVV